MPLTTSATDKAIHKLLLSIATTYKPESTSSKPMYEIERLFTKAIQKEHIRSQIHKYILNSLKDYE